jgi:hypothetical protein
VGNFLENYGDALAAEQVRSTVSVCASQACVPCRLPRPALLWGRGQSFSPRW